MRRVSFYLLLLFIFSVPWQDAVSLGGGTALSRIIGGVAFGFAFAACLLERRVSRPPGFIYALALFVLWQLVTYFWSVNPMSTIGSLTTLVQVLVMAWLVTELVSDERHAIWLLQAFVLGCLVVCALLANAYLGGQASDAYRYSPESISLNESADFIAVGTAMALVIISWAKRGLFLWVNLVYVVVGLFSIVLTASRSGFIAMCVALIGVLFVLRQTKPLRRAVILAGIVGVFALLFFALSTTESLRPNVERVTFATDTASLGTLTGRTDIWSAGLDIFSDSPVGGIGAGTFSEATRGLMGETRAAHNMFVEVGAETGLIGLLILLGVLGAAVLPVVRSVDRQKGLYLILFAVLIVVALVANVAGSKALWFVLAILSVCATGRFGAYSDVFAASGQRPGLMGSERPTERVPASLPE